MTSEEIEELFREMDERVAKAEPPRTNGVPAPNKKKSRQTKKSSPTVRKAGSGRPHRG